VVHVVSEPGDIPSVADAVVTIGHA
jgi:hypothetical protein